MLKVNSIYAEDITSKEFLNGALENTKQWCKENLPNHLPLEILDKMDYGIFRFVIDNEMFGCDMRLDEKEQGLIRVSTKKLKWYQEREDFFRKCPNREPVEIDPASMFVHEITEWILRHRLRLLNKLEDAFKYIFKFGGFHLIAYEIENINRRERGLKDWPRDYA